MKVEKGVAFCHPCGTIVLHPGGRGDLIKHSQTAKYKKNAASINTISIVKSTKNLQNLNENVSNAALKLTAFFVEHNIPFNSIDHLVKVVESSFTDPEVAKELKLGRTKITSITKNVLGDHQFTTIVDCLRQNKFSIIIDESTDVGNKNLLSIVARVAIECKVRD